MFMCLKRRKTEHFNVKETTFKTFIQLTFISAAPRRVVWRIIGLIPVHPKGGLYGSDYMVRQKHFLTKVGNYQILKKLNIKIPVLTIKYP